MNDRLTTTELTPLFSLGDLYVSDFVKNTDEYKDVKKHPLTLLLSKETKCLQLSHSVDSSCMYGKYWYRSSINTSMRYELEDIVKSAIKVTHFTEKTLFLDIASNDGTLLSFVPKDKFYTLGIDPADNTYQKEALTKADDIVQDFFSVDAFNKSKFYDERVSIITCIAMFYDLDNPYKFLNDVYDVLDDNGLFIIQQSYMPLMIKQLAFDNICHEHIFYHSLYSMEYVLDKCGFKVVDVILNDVNGGSFRLYIQKKDCKKLFASQPYRDVALVRIESLREYEKTLNLDDDTLYSNFWYHIYNLKQQTVYFIKKVKSEGKKVWVYGASTKGNTLLQWFGLDNTLIDGAAERSPYKYGFKTIGSNIPIYSEELMREENPDYLLILPWHFINEFKERELEYLTKGGHFIVPCPQFEII